MMHNVNNVLVAGGQDATIRRPVKNQHGLYDLPNFYNPDFGGRTEMSIESGNETVATAGLPTRTARTLTDSTSFVTDQLMENKSHHPGGRTEERATSHSGSGGGGLYRNKCISFLALVAGLAAFGSSLAALAGTTSWVDTWESIDLPPSQDWPTLFGTGYGSLMPNTRGGSNSSGKDKSSQPGKSASASTSGSKLATFAAPASGIDLATRAGLNIEQPDNHSATGKPTPVYPPWPIMTTRPSHLVVNTPSPPPPPISVITTTTTKATVEKKNADDEEDEFDYDDEYYAHDQGVVVVDEQMTRVVSADDVDDKEDGDETPRSNQDDQEQQDEEPRRSLVVVFHVGLFRACPVLKGELPSSVVLPNLPCAPLEYINWRPLNGQSFRLWRNLEFTTDFLNRLRYATPCFLLGSFIGLVAIVVALGGRCTGPDRTLICSSLHILAGLSLGSGLIIFVSVLHEEFSVPTLRSTRHSGGWPSVSSRLFGAHDENMITGGSSSASSSVAFYSDSRTLSTPTGYQTANGGGGSSGLVSAALIPSFRYGWSFYAALAAFVSSELAAAVYIILHTHIFKWTSRTRSAAEAAASTNSVTSKLLPGETTACKEIGIQTSPLSSSSLLMMMDKRAANTTAVAASVDVNYSQQVAYCDLLAMDPGIATNRDPDLEAQPFPSSTGVGSSSSNNSSCRPSPMYINAGSTAETDCTCQIHYATYRPKLRNANHVAGIHRASTMPRKVAFAGEVTNVYQQTPL